MANTKEQEAERFVTFALEMYKSHVGLTGYETLQLFLKYGVIDYLKESYEVLSGESIERIYAEIDEFIETRRS